MDTSTLLLGYIAVEASFFLFYAFYLVPRANSRTEPHEYRDYVATHQRHLLLLRILERMERTCKATNQNIRHWLEGYMKQWFHQHSPVIDPDTAAIKSTLPPLSQVSQVSMASSSSETSDDDEEEDTNEDWTMDDLRKDDTDTFFAWGFFAKNYTDLTREEHLELDKIYMTLQERYGLYFAKGKSSTLTPRLLTLEDVRPIHRPLLVYAGVGLFRMVGGMLLRLLGFRRHVATSDLIYWYRGCKNPTRDPLLFFHGIAPAGLMPYLPMAFSTLGLSERECFLFENKPISCSIGFHSITENETVSGVLEALENHVDSQTNVALVGHSFGSCPMTWLLHSPLRNRIRQLLFLDPVTILLSEPDVMNNFLYSHQLPAVAHDSILESIKHSINRAKIRILASSELFTEFYLRRCFSWYNSELWLDEIPGNCQVAVCLAGEDEIVNAPKVRQEVRMHNEFGDSTQVRIVYWEDAGHARCITSIHKWREIRNVVLEQEAQMKAKWT